MERQVLYGVPQEELVDSVDQLMRGEQEQIGTVAQYVDMCVNLFQNDVEYSKNMQQLEQMARIITGPFVGMGGHDFASELYWGEALGMAVGDHYFGSRWSGQLYGIMNQYFSARRTPTPFRTAFAQEDTVSLPEKARTLEEALAIADDALAMLESEKYELPDPYRQLITTWAEELSMSDMGRYFITAGFSFLVNIAFAQAKYEEQLGIAPTDDDIDDGTFSPRALAA